MDTIKAIGVIGGLSCVIVGVIFLAVEGGSGIGRKRERAEWQTELVKRGFAEYNATTSEWQWKGNSDADR